MATVNEGKVVLFGAGGPVGASAIAALKDHYTLRVTDLRPMTEVAAAPPQSPRAPIPEVLGPPHENRVVDITDYAQVLAACEGMDAAINVSVVRPHPVLAFQVNMVGAYNVAKACVACGIKRLIHTGPFHTSLNHNADYWHDFQVEADIPLHPGDDLYAVSKYLGGHITRVFAEREGLEVLAFVYTHFRPREVLPEEQGQGVHPYTTSWEDTGEAFLVWVAGTRDAVAVREFLYLCAAAARQVPARQGQASLGVGGQGLLRGVVYAASVTDPID